MLTSNDPVGEAWRAADEIADDPTPDELAHAIPEEATVCVLGWPEQIGEALPRRGDVDVLVVDALGEGSGLVRRLQRADVDAIDVPMSGLGAAVADSDLVLLEASAFGPGGWVGVAGSRAAAAVARHAGHTGVGRRWHRPCAAGPHVGGPRAPASTTTCRGKPRTTSCPPTCAT